MSIPRRHLSLIGKGSSPTLPLLPAFAEAAARRQAEGKDKRYVPPPSKGRLEGRWGFAGAV